MRFERLGSLVCVLLGKLLGIVACLSSAVSGSLREYLGLKSVSPGLTQRLDKSTGQHQKEAFACQQLRSAVGGLLGAQTDIAANFQLGELGFRVRVDAAHHGPDERA